MKYIFIVLLALVLRQPRCEAQTTPITPEERIEIVQAYKLHKQCKLVINGVAEWVYAFGQRVVFLVKENDCVVIKDVEEANQSTVSVQ